MRNILSTLLQYWDIRKEEHQTDRLTTTECYSREEGKDLSLTLDTCVKIVSFKAQFVYEETAVSVM